MSPCWHEGGLPRPLQLSKGSKAKTNGGVKIASLRANEEREIQVRISEHSAAKPKEHYVSLLA